MAPGAAEPTDCIEGPVEQIGSEIVLRIPLNEGGMKLLDSVRGAGSIEGDSLEIVIPRPLADRLKLSPGTTVVVGQQSGRFVLWRSDVYHGRVSAWSGPVADAWRFIQRRLRRSELH